TAKPCRTGASITEPKVPNPSRRSPTGPEAHVPEPRRSRLTSGHAVELGIPILFVTIGAESPLPAGQWKEDPRTQLPRFSGEVPKVAFEVVNTKPKT
ncbi:hypothetical protein Taro_011637, partial [Colocasia esculenta]|nr:hypothetical protein [Colocasia esculenta]